uniref:Uncharacterized protein n=1 Tax=Dulem virus 33 TaxID=3145751 RepID=A0AAU8B8M5_9CAUD
MFKEYNNPAWEPCFEEIAPILAKFYFSTRIGFIRRILAGMIFKKLRWLEEQNY